jgi:flagellar biosynthesis/type III secretory pathway chaperone
MTSEINDVPKPSALQYLQDIEALTTEIKAGMDAVGADALSAFKESVSKQQELCTRLSRLAGQLRAEQRPENVQLPRSASLSDYALAARIRVAVELLLDLNQHYAALLRHAQESVRLLAGLRQSYTGSFLPFDTAAAQRPGWSFQS